MNKQFTDYINSFGNIGDFKIDPSQGVEASKEILKNSSESYKQILELSFQTFQKVGEIAQKNIDSTVTVAKGIKFDDPSSLDVSDAIQGILNSNQEVANEVQNTQAKIQKIVSDCATKNLDEISKKAPKKKAA